MKRKLLSLISLMLAGMTLFAASCRGNTPESSSTGGSSDSTGSSSGGGENGGENDGGEDTFYFPEYAPDPAPTEKIKAQPARIASGRDTAYSFRIALDEEGKAWGWGANDYGQVGNGEQVGDPTAFTPQETKTDARFESVSSGATHTLAIDTDGNLWGWGKFDDPEEKQIALPTFTTPTQFLEGKKYVYAEAGTDCSFVIDTEGKLWAWGSNFGGQLGDGTTDDPDTVIPIAADKTFSYISSYSQVTYAIDTDGYLWGWGNPFINVGIGDGTTGKHLTPVAILPERKFAQVSTSSMRTYAIDENGNLWGWGGNANGQLGDGTKETQTVPVQIMAGKYFTYVEATGSATYAIDVQGKLWAWGVENEVLNLKHYPQEVASDVRFLQASEGLALDENGEIWTWGSNSNGEVGDGVTQNILSPVQVFEDMRFSKVVGYGGATAAIDTDKNLWTWGATSEKYWKNSLKQIMPEKKFKEVSTGGRHTLAIDTDGKLWAWGDNSDGQIGDGTTERRDEPVQIMPDKRFSKVSASRTFSHAIDEFGNLWAWGEDGDGEYGGAQGIGEVIIQLTPAQVKQGTKFSRVVSCANRRVFAIDTYGNLWGWGALGGGLGTQYTPVRIAEGMTFSSLALSMSAAGGNCAIDSDGYICAWGGSDDMGTAGRTPMKILENKTFSSVAIGIKHILALDPNGKLYTWGYNSCGQLGLGTKGEIVKSSECQAILPDKRFTYIFATDNHSFAIDKEGKLWAWGSSPWAQNGVSLYQTSPKKILLQ